MTGDAIDEYYECLNAQKEMQSTLQTYRVQMDDATENDDEVSYVELKIRVDMLKRSLAIVERNLVKCEEDLLFVFQDHRPGT